MASLLRPPGYVIRALARVILSHDGRQCRCLSRKPSDCLTGSLFMLN